MCPSHPTCVSFILDSDWLRTSSDVISPAGSSPLRSSCVLCSLCCDSVHPRRSLRLPDSVWTATRGATELRLDRQKHSVPHPGDTSCSCCQHRHSDVSVAGDVVRKGLITNNDSEFWLPVSPQRESAVNQQARVINSVLEGDVGVAAGAVVQHCHLQVRSSLLMFSQRISIFYCSISTFTLVKDLNTSSTLSVTSPPGSSGGPVRLFAVRSRVDDITVSQAAGAGQRHHHPGTSHRAGGPEADGLHSDGSAGRPAGQKHKIFHFFQSFQAHLMVFIC